MTIKRNTPREKKRKLSHTMKLHMTRYARPFAIRLCNGVSRESLMWLLRRGEISFEHSILSVANITDSATEETACPENVSQTATRTLATSRPGQAPAPRQVSCLASSGLELARSSLGARSQHPDLSIVSQPQPPFSALVTATTAHGLAPCGTENTKGQLKTFQISCTE